MQEHEGHSLQQARDIAIISETDDLQELVAYFYSGEPGFLRDDRQHWSECSLCSNTYPDALSRIDRIGTAVHEIALLRIEELQKQFIEEFPDFTSGAKDNRLYADKIAALASTYSNPTIWQLYFLLPEHYWKNFSVLPIHPESSEIRPITACGQHLKALSSEVLHFLFTVVLTREAYGQLHHRFWRMNLSSLLRTMDDGRLESFDNPDYPIYQAYELKASSLLQGQAGDEEDEPLYGSAILLSFIREKIRETLLEASLDCKVFYSVMDAAATKFLQEYLDQIGEGSAHSTGSVGAFQELASNGRLNEIHQDLADATDSLKAGQMEILRALQNRRRASEFLPLVESRLGAVYTKLHCETQRLLALGEYFLSINQAEPDAMNPVVLHQAKACENELYMRIFGPYLLKLFTEGTRDYPADGSSSAPLIRSGKEQPDSMTLGIYSWYLKNDFILRSWIKSHSHLNPDALEKESFWISRKRNDAAHKADFKQYDAAIFQSRVYSPQGLLASLHTQE